VDIVNGQPRVIFRAVVQVLAILAGARGGVDLPSDVKERVRSIAERLRSKFGEGGENMSEEKNIAHESQQTLDPAKVVALEQEVQRLKAEQRKRQFADELASLRFSEGKVALAPASRNKFVEVLAELNDELAGKLMDAIKSIQFVPLGELGFSATEPDEKTETLQTYAEKIARERNLNFIDAIRIAASERPDLVFSEYKVHK
jgi:predicted transcriptional regulator